VLIWLIPHDHIRKMRESAKLMILRTRQKPMVKFVMIQGRALGDGLPDGLPRPPSFCGAARASTTSRCLHWSLEERTQKGTVGDWTSGSSSHPRKCSLTLLQGSNEKRVSVPEGDEGSLRSTSLKTLTFGAKDITF